MNRLVLFAASTGLAAIALGWSLTAPHPLPAAALDGLPGDAARGEAVFWAAGCASCHTAPEATEADAPVLSGGQRFASAFGTFIAPNISSDPEHGIGDWTVVDLGNALLRGVSPDGQHYYPAFPYGSYSRMDVQDVADLHAFLATLPASSTPSLAHEVGFPFDIRRSLGGWKLLFLSDDWHLDGDLSPEVTRGRYLAEALGHCSECHTPRNALGGLKTGQWLAGAPNPSGQGTIPGITPAKLDWTEAEITEYLTSGFTPDFDSAGGHMAHVVANLARLPETDRAAIAAYLKALP